MKYDLKGSTVDREASDKERQKEKPTFKDNDFLKDGVKIHIGEEAKAKLMETLKADVNFLTNLHVMDYSLLLGVHNVDQAAEEEANRLANQGKGNLREHAATNLNFSVYLLFQTNLSMLGTREVNSCA